MCDFSSESDLFVLIQLVDRFERGRILSDEGPLLEEVRDVRHVLLLRELLDIAQQLSPWDTSQGVLDPGRGKGKRPSYDCGVHGPGGDVLVEVDGAAAPLCIGFVLARGGAPLLGVGHGAGGEGATVGYRRTGSL